MVFARRIVWVFLLHAGWFCSDVFLPFSRRHFTVSTVISTVSAVKITVHTVQCTGTHRNFSSATMSYLSTVFSCTVNKNNGELIKYSRLKKIISRIVPIYVRCSAVIKTKIWQYIHRVERRGQKEIQLFDSNQFNSTFIRLDLFFCQYELEFKDFMILEKQYHNTLAREVFELYS